MKENSYKFAKDQEEKFHVSATFKCVHRLMSDGCVQSKGPAHKSSEQNVAKT